MRVSLFGHHLTIQEFTRGVIAFMYVTCGREKKSCLDYNRGEILVTCPIYCVAMTGGFKSFPSTKLIDSHMDCMEVGKYFNFFLHARISFAIGQKGLEKLHSTRILGLASGIRLELDSKGHCKQPEQCSVGVFTAF